MKFRERPRPQLNSQTYSLDCPGVLHCCRYMCKSDKRKSDFHMRGKKKKAMFAFFLCPCNRPVIYSHLTLEWREQRVLPIYVTPQQYLLLWTKTLPVDCLFVILMMSHCCFIFSSPVRMDTTEQCNAVISHFNGKFIKIASGALGRKEFCTFLYTFLPIKTVEAVMIDCRVTVNMSVFFFSVLCPQLPLSRCCVSLQTVRGRNMLRADLFPMDSQGISD